MKNLLTIALTVLTATVLGQDFQGKIVYENTFVSKLPNVSNEQFTTMMGSMQTYLVKGGDYKSIANGTLVQWQLYINKDNKLYNKMSNSETIIWNDGSTNPDEVLKVELNKGVTEVLGYKCDEVVLTCKSGIQKYYFSSILAVDISLFARHQYGNWYDYLKVAKALPLKSVVDNSQFNLISIATEVQQMNIDDNEFELPKDAKTAQSPY